VRSESLREMRISVTTIGDLLLTAADRYPDSDAIVFPEARLNYGQLVERSLKWARALRAAGVQPGEHVGLLMPTSFDFVEIMFGISLAGAVIVPVNARYKPSELAYVIENGDLVTLVTTDRVAEHVNFVERLNQALPSLAAAKDPLALSLPEAPRLRNVVLMGRDTPAGFVPQRRFEDLAGSVPEDEIHQVRLGVRVRDVGLMLYTSGTTANPKGCLLSHEAIVRNSIALGRHRYQLKHEDRFWSPLPMFHIAAILPMLAIFDVGGAYVTMGYFDAGVALHMLDRENATATYPCFVTIMSDLIYHKDFDKVDLSRVRLMNSNFAVQPKGIADAMQKAMPNAIQVGTFGMTETAGTVTTSRLDDPLEQRINRLGKPLPGLRVRIVDPDTGEDAGPGQRGEVLVKGQGREEDGRGHRRRRLVSHGRHRLARRARHADVPRPLQGHAQGGRRERGSRRDRGLPAEAPGCEAGTGGRHPGPALRRGTCRLRRAEAGRGGQREGAHRALSPRAGRVQGTPTRAVRRRVADVDEQDPEVPVARPVDHRAEARLRRTAGDPGPMFCFIAKLNIKPDREGDFLRLQAELSEATRAEAGCLAYDVLKAKDSPLLYVYYARFRDQAAFDEHMRTEAHDRLIPPIMACVDGEMDLQFYDFVI